MRILDEQTPLLPQWINGRAYLYLSQTCCDITCADGKTIRRTALCSEDVAEVAADAAVAALPIWYAQPRAQRVACLNALAEQLEVLHAHFARLLDEEGCPNSADELDTAIENLRSIAEPVPAIGRVSALICDCATGAFASVCGALAALLPEGATVILIPPPAAPSAMLALAELASVHGLPDGVFNVVFGNTAFSEALCALPQIEHVLHCPER